MSYTEIFEELCPQFMAYGMTYEQYWQGDPWMVRAYAQTFLLKRRIDNETMWLMGSYVANAFSVVLHNAFNSTKKDYLKQPMDIFPKTEAERKAEIREERRKLITWLNGMTRKFNLKKKDTGSESDGKS